MIIRFRTNRNPNTSHNRARRWLAAILYNLGVMAAGIWLWSAANNTVVPDWEGWSFDKQSRGVHPTVWAYLKDRGDGLRQSVDVWLGLEPPPTLPSLESAATVPQARPVLPVNATLGRLQIPRLGIRTVVREGDGEKTLVASLGHIPGTALPGDSGNVGVAGHRDTFFRALEGIRKSDLLQFETLNGIYSYEVVGTQIVKPSDVGVLRPGSGPEITLVTCYPFGYVGNAPDRFIVKARQLPLTADVAEVKPPEPQPATIATVAAPAVEAHPPKPPAVDAVTERVLGRGVVSFSLVKGRARILAPGVHLGITDLDPNRERFTAWIWLKSNKQTIWLVGRRAAEPIVFYDETNSDKYQLTITRIQDGSAAGLLLLPADRE